MIFSNFISGGTLAGDEDSRDSGSYRFFEGASLRLKRFVSSSKIQQDKKQEMPAPNNQALKQQQQTKLDDWQLERKYTLDEVQEHSSLEDCWIVIFDKVYNITDFVFEHPGGDFILLEYAGSDATQAFLASRHGSSAYKMLDKYWIGILVDEELCYSNNSSYCSVYSNLSWRKNLKQTATTQPSPTTQITDATTTITIKTPDTITTPTTDENNKSALAPEIHQIANIELQQQQPSSSPLITLAQTNTQTTPFDNQKSTASADISDNSDRQNEDSYNSDAIDDDDDDNDDEDDALATATSAKSGAIKITNNNKRNFYYSKTLNSPVKPSRLYLRTPSTLSTQNLLNTAHNYYQPTETISNAFELKSELINSCESPFFLANLVDCYD